MFHWVVVAYSFNSCIWDVEASEFEASLVYRASSRAVKNYNREILSKKKKIVSTSHTDFKWVFNYMCH